MRYKMRAECKVDIRRFIRLIRKASIQEGIDEFSITYHDTGFGTDADFNSGFSLERIKQILREVPDGHVMRETVNLLEVYTGKRTYEA